MNLKEINWKNLLEKKYWKIYAIILVALVVAITVIILLVGGNDNEDPQETLPNTDSQVTTPATTTPDATTPEVTTPAGPAETVTFPSDEDDDPKQEDNFFE